MLDVGASKQAANTTNAAVKILSLAADVLIATLVAFSLTLWMFQDWLCALAKYTNMYKYGQNDDNHTHMLAFSKVLPKCIEAHICLERICMLYHLRFPFTGTKGTKHVPAWQCNKVMVWCEAQVAEALTLSQVNTFGLNWNTNCVLNLLTHHQYWSLKKTKKTSATFQNLVGRVKAVTVKCRLDPYSY